MKRAAVAWVTLAIACAHARSQSLYEVPRDGAAPATGAASVVFDKRTAAEMRLRSSPAYVESIYVVGRNPDARAPKALEVRFADTLTAPRSSPLSGINPIGDTPCMSLPSTWNSIGDTHVPFSGCPR